MTDHFNELRNRFEQIINEYNLVKDIFENYKQKSNDFTWKLIHEKRKEIDKIRLQIDKYQKTSK
jgi:archaellum component FlaC